MTLKNPWTPAARIYLSGHVAIEGPAAQLRSPGFPGRQGRELFCLLVSRRNTSVTRSEAAYAIWGDRLPTGWDSALSALASKLRRVLARAGLDGAATLRSMDNCYEISFPPDTWIDHDTAVESIHQAETAMRAGDFQSAYGPSAVAWAIARRPFLPGVSSEWVEARRATLKDTLVRALECRSSIYLWNREPALAVRAAREATAAEPFRESAYCCLMRAAAAGGNRGEAVRAYEECRRMLVEELGVGPSAQTRQTLEEIVNAHS